MATKPPTLCSGGIAREVTTAGQTTSCRSATFNVENLDPSDPQSKFDGLAASIVDNLASPTCSRSKRSRTTPAP